MKLKGYVYAITSPTTDRCYIGSTDKPVLERLKGHVGSFKHYMKGGGNYCGSYELIKTGRYDIDILEKVRFTEKETLRKREREYINLFDTFNVYLKQ